ncbi:MAG: GNAT family N-acyltransferase [Pseudomonadota bacterium]
MAKDHDISTLLLERGGLRARVAYGADVIRSQRLRHACFIDAAGLAGRPDGLDADPFDARCDHVVIEDCHDNLLAVFRVMTLEDGHALGRSYAAQFYDLSALSGWSKPMIELGRFCVAPGAADPDVMRVAWGALTRLVDASGAGMLFGCSSFAGNDPDVHRLSFDLLAAHHLAPATQRPDAKAPEVVRFAQSACPVANRKAAVAALPPLLKTYLSMGGWVSDHAVIDRDLNTMHVFTGVEIAAIPPARAKALRLIAGSPDALVEP